MYYFKRKTFVHRGWRQGNTTLIYFSSLLVVWVNVLTTARQEVEDIFSDWRGNEEATANEGEGREGKGNGICSIISVAGIISLIVDILRGRCSRFYGNGECNMRNSHLTGKDIVIFSLTPPLPWGLCLISNSYPVFHRPISLRSVQEWTSTDKTGWLRFRMSSSKVAVVSSSKYAFLDSTLKAVSIILFYRMTSIAKSCSWNVHAYALWKLYNIKLILAFILLLQSHFFRNLISEWSWR